MIRKKNIILGSANFSLEYGIANKDGKKGASKVKSILDCAIDHGISHVDTASSYGDSESLIGTFWDKKQPLNIMSKLARNDCRDPESIIGSVRRTKSNTRQATIWCLLLHNPEVLFEREYSHVKRTLLELSHSGQVANLGVSAYSEDEILRTKDIFPELNIFQLTENICDRRNYESRQLKTFSEQGNEIYVRSIFLQGLLLMNPQELPAKVEMARARLEEFQDFCFRESLSKVEACVLYAISIPWASGLIFGVDSTEQLTEILAGLKASKAKDFTFAPKFDDWLLDPRNWS